MNLGIYTPGGVGYSHGPGRVRALILDTVDNVPQSLRQSLRSVLLCLLTPAIANAQPADPAALVRRAVAHRIEAAKNHPPHEYVVRSANERRDTTKLIIETADGDVARLIAYDGKPLTPEANAAELDRLDTLAAHPEQQERRRKSEAKDRDRITHLLSLLPDAFLYKYEGNLTCGTKQCADFSFTPNPHWSPPDLEAGIFRGLAGHLWIDQSAERMVRLDGHFIADADVGFGLIGRIDRGGTALLEESDIGNNDWELANLAVQVNGKAFLFKSFTYHVDEHTSHFSPVAPNLHYRDAIQMLKQLPPSALVP
jgi:hypothetical protein